MKSDFSNAFQTDFIRDQNFLFGQKIKMAADFWWNGFFVLISSNQAFNFFDKLIRIKHKMFLRSEDWKDDCDCPLNQFHHCI